MDVAEFVRQFQDHLAPKLDTYEQAIYLYIFRHTRLEGRDDHVLSFKSARKRLACGVGTRGTPMGENTAYEKLKSLQGKGCIEVLESERFGQRIRLRLPSEIPGVIVPVAHRDPPDIETLDFFNVSDFRKAILVRESHQCFYCLRKLSDSNYVVEHVVSRPEGDNSFRNVVASCRACNNRKGENEATDFLRGLYREGLLSESELPSRIQKLEELRAGRLRPMLNVALNLE